MPSCALLAHTRINPDRSMKEPAGERSETSVLLSLCKKGQSYTILVAKHPRGFWSGDVLGPFQLVPSPVPLAKHHGQDGTVKVQSLGTKLAARVANRLLLRFLADRCGSLTC